MTSTEKINLSKTQKIYANIIKRLLDIIFSLITAILLSPFYIVVPILIKIDSKGPVFFKQERLGKDGKVFKIYKYRSMIVGAEKKGSGVYSFKGDPRVTKLGKFIRKTSIDELPQVINIFKGEMSFIGPRPTLTYHPWSLSEYSEFQVQRFLVKPGITGLAQTKGRKEIEWTKRIEYDVEYIKNISLLNDIKLLFTTVIRVLSMQDNENISKTNN